MSEQSVNVVFEASIICETVPMETHLLGHSLTLFLYTSVYRNLKFEQFCFIQSLIVFVTGRDKANLFINFVITVFLQLTTVQKPSFLQFDVSEFLVFSIVRSVNQVLHF